MANNTALSIPKMVSASNKFKKRRLDALPKAQSVLWTTTSSPRASRKKPAKSATAHRQLYPDVTPSSLPTDNPTPIAPSHSPNPSTSVAQPDQPRTLGHAEPIASDGPWRGVQRKRHKISSAEKSSSDPPRQHARVPRDQCLIVHRHPETRADTGSLETRHDIDELLKVIKHIVPPGQVVIILKTRRRGPRVAKLPNSSRPRYVESFNEIPLPSPWLPPEHLFSC